MLVVPGGAVSASPVRAIRQFSGEVEGSGVISGVGGGTVEGAADQAGYLSPLFFSSCAEVCGGVRRGGHWGSFLAGNWAQPNRRAFGPRVAVEPDGSCRSEERRVG